MSPLIYDSYVGLCKVETEILKEAENAKKITFLDQKMSFFSIFRLFSKFHFLACTTLLICYKIRNGFYSFTVSVK